VFLNIQSPDAILLLNKNKGAFSMTVKNIEKTILQLSPAERIHIVENILDSLHKPDPEIEQAWITESEKRYSAFKKGKVKAIPLESIKKRIVR
jgi:putative addiction module component (TIGR02574 family)